MSSISKVPLELFIVIVFTLLITVPFMARPFDMDDVIFLKLAEARQEEPLLLELRDFDFFGFYNETFIDTHPPLLSMYLALMIKLGGSYEVWLHLPFIVFPLMASLSLYFLARRYTGNALFVALIFTATPGVAVMSHTLMSDLPGLAFWLVATAFYVYGLDKHSPVLLAASGLFLALGIFTSYQVLAALPLLFFYALLRRRLSVTALWPLIFPLGLFILFTIWHLTATASLPGLKHIYYVQKEPLALRVIFEKIISLACAVGGATVFPLVLLAVLVARKKDLFVFLCLLFPVLIFNAVRYLAAQSGLIESILLSLFLPLGLFFLFKSGTEGWRLLRDTRGDNGGDRAALGGMLLLWIEIIFIANVFLLPFSAVKYVMPLFPAVILIFVWLAEERFSAARVRNILAAAVLATAAMGVLVSFADYDLAAAKRLFTETGAARYGQEAGETGNRLWFSGEFGVRYYMEKQGYEELSERSPAVPGDLVVFSMMAGSKVPAPFEDRLRYIDSYSIYGSSPLRVNDHRAGAGFYGSRWGPLPYSFSSDSLDEYLTYRVEPAE